MPQRVYEKESLSAGSLDASRPEQADVLKRLGNAVARSNRQNPREVGDFLDEAGEAAPFVLLDPSLQQERAAVVGERPVLLIGLLEDGRREQTLLVLEEQEVYGSSAFGRGALQGLRTTRMDVIRGERVF